MYIQQNVSLRVAMIFFGALILLSCAQSRLPTATRLTLPTATVTQTISSDRPNTDGLVQTAQLFADGLSVNDDKLLKTIVVEELWMHIDTWLANHKPITCGFSLKRLLEQPDFTVISSPVPDRTDVWQVNVVLVFSCPTGNGNTYSLLINQALVKYTGQKWLVIEWPDIEETNP